MTRLLFCIMFVFVMAIVSGCALLVKEPVVSVSSTDIIGIDTNGFDLELLLGVDNPNSFNISLLGYTYDLQIMSVPFSKGGLQKAINFPAKQHVDVRLPFRVHHSDLVGIIKRRPDLDKIPYVLDARLNLDTPFGELVIPIKKSDTVSVPAVYRPETYLKRILQPFKELR